MLTWKGKPAKVQIALKIDGIQARLENGQVLSRANKPLYNIDPSLLEEGKKYEVFLGSFKVTQSILRSHNHKTKVTIDHIYEIWPGTDPRLLLPMGDIEFLFNRAIKDGYEGLVVDQKYKVKPKETYDVAVTGIIPGKGKHSGRMGALLTSMGKVGTGFDDAEREEIWTIGDIIEVECMSLTPDHKFRHPRFIRRRWDKITENLEK